MWTNGTTRPGGDLQWFGVEALPSAGGGYSYEKAPSHDPEIEDPSTNGGESYRALWTQHNQNNWPKAVKVRFALKDYRLLDYLPKELRRSDHVFSRGYLYEVICNIGQ